MPGNNSVGQISLDMVLNQSGFNKSLKNIQGTANNAGKSMQQAMSGACQNITNVAKKAAAAMAAAFSVKKLIDFSKKCIDLGSDLTEVQNVVDVTFGTAAESINDFAKNAAESFGLSELSAKQYTSTIGAMFKSMGITGNAVTDMSVKIAELSADMASFYNLDTDEAFAKIRSGISGETEPLKQLGINMSTANLEAYALKQGITKAYGAMSQAEQATLRYQYLLSVTADAQGDFARTSDSWANQTKILALRFDSLKASVGQGLINALTPVLQTVNNLIGKLQTAADAFRDLTAAIFGDAGGDDGMAGTADAAQTAADASDQMQAGMEGTAKAAKEADKYLAGFDAINKMSAAPAEEFSNPDPGGGGEGGSGAGIEVTTLETAAKAADKLKDALNKVKTKAQDVADKFKVGFNLTYNPADFEGIRGNLETIRTKIGEIFTDPNVQGALSGLMNTWITNAGAITGNFATLGTSLFSNLTGAAAEWLEMDTPRIQDHIVNMAKIGERASEITTDLSTALTTVAAGVLESDGAQQLEANAISIYSNAVMGITELSAQLATDVYDTFTAPFIENAGLITECLNGLITPAAEVSGAIRDTLCGAIDHFKSVYDEKITPMFEALKQGHTDTVEKFLTIWQEHVQPVIEKLGNLISTTLTEHVQPFFNSVGVFIGDCAEKVQSFYQNIIKPIIDWIIQTIIPVVAPIFQTLFETISGVANKIWDVLKKLFDNFHAKWENNGKPAMDAIGKAIKWIFDEVLTPKYNYFKNNIWPGIKMIIESVGKLIEGLLDVLGGFIDFMTGVFSGNLSQALEGIKTVFRGAFNAVIGFMNGMIGGLNALLAPLREVVVAAGRVFGANWDMSIISLPQLPYLANGGYVQANTPQLAVIGDNKRYGEIVAPENKLNEMLDNAIARSGGSSDVYGAVMQLIGVVQGMDLTLDGEKVTKHVVRSVNQATKQNGFCAIVT